MRTDACGQLLRRKQAVRFNDGPLAMHPRRLNRMEPGAFRWESKGQNAHAVARLCDLLMVFSDPDPHDLTAMPGRMIPDQHSGALALRRQPLAAPVETWGRDVAHRMAHDTAQPHLIALRIVWLPFLPQDPIPGQRVGVGVALFPGRFFQTHGMLCALPGVHARKGKAAPPHLIKEPNRPVRLVAGPGDQGIASVFLSRSCGSVKRSVVGLRKSRPPTRNSPGKKKPTRKRTRVAWRSARMGPWSH